MFGRKSTRKATRRSPFRISRPIGYASHVERLEDRTLLASNILASLESSVNQPNDSTELVLNVGPGSSPTLGFEVRASASSTFDPAAIQIFDANTNAVIPLNLAENDHNGPNSLVLATLNPGEYKILVNGQTADTGGFIVDVFLPGDMDGSGTVSDPEYQHALAAFYQHTYGYNHFTAQFIQQLGLDPSADYYSEELDGDKDGDVDNNDLLMMNSNRNIPPIQLELIGDQDAPAVDAGLEVDSGISDSDGISNELTIVGTVTDESLITQFKVALDGGSFVDIFGELSGGANGGTFTLTRGWLETNLNSGASLEGGTHTLHFMTEDEHGNISSAGMFDVNFELDTIAPSQGSLNLGSFSANEDFGTYTVNPLSAYINQNGGTALQYEAVHVSGDDLVTFDFSTDDLTFNSILDAFGAGVYKIIATDLAGNSFETPTFNVFITAINDAPVAVDDQYTTNNEDDVFNAFGPGLVIANDTDVENDMLTVVEVNGSSGDVGTEITIGAGGKLTLESDGSFSFDPDGVYNYLAAGETATETFTYTISDGNGGTDTATVTIIITGTNDDPVAENDALTTDEDTVLFGGDVFADNGSGADSDDDTTDTLTVVGITDSVTTGTVGSAYMLASGAIVTIQSDGTFDYDPNGAFEGLAVGQNATDSFTYTIDDGNGGTDTATVTITIDGVNDAPVAENDGFSTDEDTVLVGGDVFADNGNGTDSDVDLSDTLTVTGINQGMTTGTVGSAFSLASGAIVTLQSDGTFDYDPNGAFESLAITETATDSFTYTIDDGNGGTDTATVTITIDGVNDDPLAQADAFTTDEDTVLTGGDLFADNGSGPDSDPDTSDIFTVSEVNGVSMNVGTQITLGSGALLTLNVDGTFDYDPNGAFEGLAVGDTDTDSFTYTIDDGNGGTDTATVTITINGVNDPPIAENDGFTTDEDTILVGGLLFEDNGNGTDRDPDLTDVFSVTGISEGMTTGTVGSPFVLASGAIVTVQSAGTFSYDPNGVFESLAVGETDTDTFTYTIMDPFGGTDTATVTITITGVNDDPTAEYDEFATDEDTVLTGGNVLVDNGSGADSDPDTSDTLMISEVNGVSGNVGTQILLPSGALLTMNADGTFEYDPNGAFEYLSVGDANMDSFTYTIDDGHGGTDTATVAITVHGVNDVPTAQDDAFTINEDTTIAGGDLFADNGNGVDSDPDSNDEFLVSEVNGSAGNVDSQFTLPSGALLLVNNDGGFNYDPNGVYNYLAVGETAQDSFTYQISDGNGGSDTATVTITITGLNDDPTANNDEFSTDEDTVLTGGNVLIDNVNGADSDPDTSDTLMVTEVNGASGDVGTQITLGSGALLTLNADGTFEYDPNGVFENLSVDEPNMDSFTYTIDDGHGGTDTATVSITIIGVNDAPTAQDDAFTIDEETTITGGDLFADNGSGADSDPDTLDTPFVSLVNGSAGNVDSQFSLGSGALLLVNNDGTFNYDPNGAYDYLAVGEIATETFTYTLSDGNGGTDTATVTITINGVNNPPVAQPDAIDVNKEQTINGNVFADNGSGVDSDVDASDTFNVTDVNGQSGDVGMQITLGSNALLTLNADGTFTYDPNGQFNHLTGLDTATDTFTYKIDDGNGGTDTATVTLTISANQMPIANLDMAATDEETALPGIDVLANDTDPDGDDNNLVVVSLFSMFSSGGAFLSLNMDGTVSYDPTGAFDYLSAGQMVTDTFTYTVGDERGGFATGTVQVTVTGVNDDPTVSAPVESTTTEDDGSVDVDLLANASDVDANDTLSISAMTKTNTGNDGGISINGTTLTINSSFYNNLSFNESEVITYSYNIEDGNGGVVAQTATITINGENDAPTVSMGVVSTPTEDDGQYVLNLLSNASDVDLSDTLSVMNLVKTSGDASGINVNGNQLTITPSVYNGLAAGETEVIEYTYDVIDGNGGSVAQTATITINGVNDAPTVTVQTISETRTEDDGSFSIDLLQNASDVDTTDVLMVDNLVKFSGNNVGVTVNGNTLDIDPSEYNFLAAGEVAVVVYHYDVIDGNGGSVPLIASITITGVNDPPVAQNDGLLNTTEDTVLDSALVGLGISVLDDNDAGPDSDVDLSDTLSVTGIADGFTTGTIGNPFMLASGAIVTLQSDGTFTYDPNNAFEDLAVGENTTDTFTYTLSDGNGGTDTATVTITIDGVNDAPVAADDEFSTNQDFVLTGENLFADNSNGADSDIDASDSLTVMEISQGGSVGTVGSGFTLASGAIVNVLADGTFSYDPNGAFDYLGATESAVDQFTYTIEDDEGVTDTATVTVTVFGLNDPPVAADDDITLNDENSILLGNDVFADNGNGADSDVDATDMLTVIGITDGVSTGTVGSAYVLDSGASVLLSANGIMGYFPNGAFNSLAVGETATDSFTYTISDGNGGTDTATVTITIIGANDPPNAVADDVVTNEDTILVGADVFVDNGNGVDSDVDTTDMLTVTGINQGMTTGTVGSGFTLASGAIVTMQSDGTFSYNPNGAFEHLAVGDTATDTFTYTISDGNGGMDSANVQVLINGVNDDPQVSAAVTSTSTEDDGIVNVDLLTNASDVDQNDTLSVTNLMQTNGGNAGGITMTTASSWSIDTSFYSFLPANESEVITYSYDVIDGNGGTVAQTLTITIDSVNDAPVAQPDAFSTDEDTTLVGGDVFADNGSGVDSDIDELDSFTVTGISEGMTSGTVGLPFVLSSGANVTIMSDGTFDYNPDGAFENLAVGETATDEFTYTIDDGNGGTDTATVTITINGVNDPVMAADDAVTTTKDTPLNFDVRLDNGSGPDTDADTSDTLLVTEITDTMLGTATATVGMPIILDSGATVTLQLDGTLVYDPNGQFPSLVEPTDVDTDMFTYKISDGTTTDTATVTVTVTGSNELLVATDEPLVDIFRDGLTPETIDLDLHFNDPDVGDTVTYMVDTHVEGDMPGDALPANFWANVSVSGSDLNITYTDYSSEQVRLPLVITVTAHSDDTISPDVIRTFKLIPDPQSTVDIRLIARNVASSGRDFTSFRAELNVTTLLADELGGARFQLVNGLQDLNYSIYLGDYGLDVDGTANGDSTDDLKELRIIDTTNDNVLFTVFSNSSADDNPTIDSVNDILTGTWTLGEGLSSAIIDKLYDGVLAVEVIENTGGAGTASIASGGNIVVSPEVADVTDLPSSVSQVAVGDQYVVEMWISDRLAQVLAGVSTPAGGVSSLIMDMIWDVADASLVDDQFTIDTSAFGFLTNVTSVDGPGGVLSDISATSVLPDLASNGYGRVGYAIFSADDIADDVDFMIDTTDILTGVDGVNRDVRVNFSQLSITNTSVDQVTPSEFFIQTDLSNLSVSGTITVDGQEINLLPQSAGSDATSVSGRLDVLLDDVNSPGTIQIVDSYIEVNPSGDARPDRGLSDDYSILDLADFGLVGDQLIPDVFSTFDGEINLAIRDAIAQVISSPQAIDGSGNFDISENWLLENGLLDSMISLPGFTDTVVDSNSESTAGETMSFFDPLTMAPVGLAAWSQANLTLVSPGVYELLIPISRRIEFTTSDGADVVLNLVGSATARFDVNQDDTDEAGDTLATAEVTGLTSAAPGTQVFQGVIGNNTVIADPLLDVDMYEIQLDAGDSVIVDVDANMFETGLDSIVRIFDSLGNQVAYSDDDLAPDEFLVNQLSTPLDSYVTFTASSTGTYYIGVSAYNDSNDPSTYDPTNTAGRPTGVDPADVGSYDLTITVQEGALPLHGTQAIVTDTTLDAGTAVDLVVVRTQTELNQFGQTSELPASDTWIDEWSSFWVEVYVETADARGITDAAVDLNYNTNFFSATEIEFSSAFAASGQAVIDDTTGVVTGLSGTAIYEKVGNGEKTLLARVKFESLSQDDVSIDFEDKFIGPHALGLSLSNVSVNLTNGSDTTLIVGDAPETDLWAIAYDVNDDDQINARDLVVMITIYGQNVLDSDSPYVWALDADKSGTVDHRDLRYFISNYGVQKGGDRDVVYPANFLQRWYGKTTDITGDSSIDQVMDEALGIWQDALGLEEPLDIQLVITNLGGTQLGEGQITGVDSEGRPVSGIVTLDDNAAGLGWYSDLDSSAFGDTVLEGGVAYTADAGSDAAGHYDLLTVLLHEIGHVLGFTETYAPFESFVQTGVGGTLSFVGSGFEATLTDDGLHLDDTVHAGDVMNATLDPGVRKLPSILDALILQSAHEAAASGSFEILVGVNAPLMANLPADEQLETSVEPLAVLESNTVVFSNSVSEFNESVLPEFNLTRNQLDLNSSTLNQVELDLTVLEGLNDELVSNLRLNGLSIVDSREHSPSSDANQTETDTDLLGLTQEFDAGFDDVFSDWAGPIL
ncbi:beta strand repeat-containing protein [Gimesia alba]|uniref:beta strand repeat-containing protein n=1 Tax=Gimesia alba TaxID=2527973 RepID=UPI0018D6921E|nr:Ig-like domain-containing protein [Gimesia alba]